MSNVVETHVAGPNRPSPERICQEYEDLSMAWERKYDCQGGSHVRDDHYINFQISLQFEQGYMKPKDKSSSAKTAGNAGPDSKSDTERVQKMISDEAERYDKKKLESTLGMPETKSKWPMRLWSRPSVLDTKSQKAVFVDPRSPSRSFLFLADTHAKDEKAAGRIRFLERHDNAFGRAVIDLSEYGIQTVHLTAEFGMPQFYRGALDGGILCFIGELSPTADELPFFATKRQKAQVRKLREGRKNVDFGERLQTIKSPVIVVASFSKLNPLGQPLVYVLLDHFADRPLEFPCFPCFAGEYRREVMFSKYKISDFPCGLAACMNRHAEQCKATWDFESASEYVDNESSGRMVLQRDATDDTMERGAKRQKTALAARDHADPINSWCLRPAQMGTDLAIATVGKRSASCHSTLFSRRVEYLNSKGQVETRDVAQCYGYHAQVQKCGFFTEPFQEDKYIICETLHHGMSRVQLISLEWNEKQDKLLGSKIRYLIPPHVHPLAWKRDQRVQHFTSSQELLYWDDFFAIIQETSFVALPTLWLYHVKNPKEKLVEGEVEGSWKLLRGENFSDSMYSSTLLHFSDFAKHPGASGALVLPKAAYQYVDTAYKEAECALWSTILGVPEEKFGPGRENLVERQPTDADIKSAHERLAKQTKKVIRAYLQGEIGKEPKELPVSGLAIQLHGGPHGVSIPTYSPVHVLLPEALKVPLFFPNYRGSTSFSREFNECLLGKAGVDDVADCEGLTNELLKVFSDPSATAQRRGLPLPVFVMGGSHGGFLTAHLIGRNKIPNIQCGIMRNPVTDLEGMVRQTDIPEWIFAEALNRTQYKWSELSDEDCIELKKKSPVSSIKNVTCDVLMLLGDSDLRVPMGPNGKAYVELLRRLRSAEKTTSTVANGNSASANGGPSSGATSGHLPQQIHMEIFEGEGHGFDKEHHIAKANLLTLEWIRRRILL
ncbi:unnamed protein product [Amoebophrya sp. A120]|nr:unnamed protein product [Amoebophrya sp. A120]|eukprot:GSA120T00003057001.1